MAPAYPELLARLVAFDTTSVHSNLALLDFLANHLERPGVALRRWPSADGTKANLTVVVGPPVDPASRAGLTLSGHMDTVPAGEPGWTSDPFTLTDRGDRWVARGACDMKGFLALAADLARHTDPASLKAPLALAFTYDEELGCLGAHHLVTASGEPPCLPRATVIGEPTELRAVRLHKGHLKLRVTFRGKSAHSGYPHLGDNAIERAVATLGEVGTLRRRLAGVRTASSDFFPEVPYPALNLGTIHGGTAINVVPESCRFELGIRLLPGLATEPLVDEVRAIAARAAGPGGFELEVLSVSPPFQLDADTGIYRALTAEVGAPEDPSVSFATDAGWLQELGLDCAIFGPGSIAVAHQPDEFVPKSDMAAAHRVLGRLIERFCRAEAA